MGEDDIEILAFAEKNADPNSWNMPIFYEGKCKIGCKGRKLSRTKNLFAVGSWIGYHREGPEHIAKLLERSGGNPDMMPEISGQLSFDAAEFDTSVFKSTNGEETQP